MTFSYIHTPIHALDYQVDSRSNPPRMRGVLASRSTARTGDWSRLILSDEDIICGSLYYASHCRLDPLIAEVTYFQHISLCRELTDLTVDYSISDRAMRELQMPLPPFGPMADMRSNPLLGIRLTPIDIRCFYTDYQQLMLQLQAWVSVAILRCDWWSPDSWVWPEPADPPPPFVLRDDWCLDNVPTPRAFSFAEVCGTRLPPGMTRPNSEVMELERILIGGSRDVARMLHELSPSHGGLSLMDRLNRMRLNTRNANADSGDSSGPLDEHPRPSPTTPYMDDDVVLSTQDPSTST
ncbi:hypothetical protein M422DRAFT_248623 [Sphaerobolus stellatus SS14]|nr:hypothetical protein M422DRAFT_248623 [Sphaerobolus stellatus SS14]